VSANGIDFTSIGSIVGGLTGQHLDFAGDSYRFVKMVNTSTIWDGYDFDLVTARTVVPIPEPTSFTLGLGGLALLGLARRRVASWNVL
jgi:MYXO-CTERM domain-containing protein